VIVVSALLVAGLLLWRSGATDALFGTTGSIGTGGTPSGTPGGSGPPAASSSPSAAVPPACSFGKRAARAAGYSDWRRTLLDTRFSLPPTYAPPGLQPVSAAGFTSALLVRRGVIADLGALRQAAAAAGHPIDIVAAYRSYRYQTDLFQRRVDDWGYEKAIRKTARPGHSEHQLGTAVEFKIKGTKSPSAQFGSPPTGRWLFDNAYRFGFVLSYPQGQQALTCYAYEPWHYRYFGRRMAAKIHASGVTTRQYLWDLQKRHPTSPSD